MSIHPSIYPSTYLSIYAPVSCVHYQSMCRDDVPAPPDSLRRVQCRARAEDAIQSHMCICSESPDLVFRDARARS